MAREASDAWEVGRERARHPSSASLFLAAVFLASGLTSLVYQVVWQRVLTQEVGLDATSIATIVTIFMTGLGFGALAGARISRRFAGHLVPIYAAVEVAIGLYGAAAIPLLRSANAAVASLGHSSAWTDFLLNFVLLIGPTLLMGTTTPLIVQLATTDLRRLGRSIGIYYGLNILGAALGAFVSGLVLIELLGLRGTALAAAALNLGIGALFLVVGRRLFTERPARIPRAPGHSRGLPRNAIASLLFGFVTLAYEIVLFRVGAYNFASHVYVFPLMLLFFLAMMGLGNLLSGLVVDRLDPRQQRPYLCVLLILAAAATFLLFSSPKVMKPTISAPFLALATLPVVFLAGFFPVMVKLMAVDEPHAGGAAGRTLFWYTVGNLLGSLVTAFVLLETLGSIATVRLALFLSFLGILVLADRQALDRRRLALVATTLALLAALTVAIPGDYWLRGTRFLASSEGREGVVTYHRNVMLNGRGAARVFEDVEKVRLSQHNMAGLMVVDPDFRPRSVLIIGLGAGSFAWGLVPYEFVESITIVELSQEVLDFVLEYSDPEIVDALRSDKVTLSIQDGRRYLRQAAARGERFDLIQAGTFYPDQVGSANLYSADFMESIRRSLEPGGYYATLDCEGLIETARSVFRHGFVVQGAPHLMFLHDHEIDLAGARSIPPWLGRSLRAWSYTDLAGPLDALAHGSLIVHDIDDLRLHDHPRNTDDRPTFEYRFLRQTRGRYHTVRNRLFELARTRRAPGSRVSWRIAPPELPK